MRVELERRTLRLAAPLETAYGHVSERELVLVTLTGTDRISGQGEAAPLEPYDGVSIERVLAALEAYVPVLEEGGRAPDASGRARFAGGRGRFAGGRGLDGGGRLLDAGGRLLDACREVDPLPQALAAVDLALWDRAGRREGRPVAQLLSDGPASRVPVNASIAASDRAGAAREATAAVRAGFGCVKLKVGLGDDAGRVAAVRAAAGPGVELRLDANGAWQVEEAVRAIEELAPSGLELVEEPVSGIEAVRAVRDRVAVRIAIDETAREPGALGAGVADAVCLKISASGGISALLAAAALVRASGAEIYLASTYDGPVGVAAAVHAAAALATRGPLPHCGLATLGLFETPGRALLPDGGAIAVPLAPGLGVG